MLNSEYAARCNMNRRKFLTIASIAGGALVAGKALHYKFSKGRCLAAPESNPRIAIARDERITLTDAQHDRELVKALLDESVRAVTDKKKAEDAWKALFSRRDRVAIKTSCLPGKFLSSNVALVEAIIEGLRSAGVKDENILIWERTSRELERAGFTINRGNGVKCFGTDGAYELEPEAFRSIGSRFSRVLTRFCTAIVNVPVLKDHDIAGVSLGMKNFFGVIDNPNKYHGNNCDPYIADLSLHPQIRRKLRLIVCDGLRAQCDGGPAYKPDRAWMYCGIIVGRDPVAVDYQGLKIIEARRKELDMPPLERVKREPKHIKTAAEIGVGTSDPEAATIIEI